MEGRRQFVCPKEGWNVGSVRSSEKKVDGSIFSKLLLVLQLFANGFNFQHFCLPSRCRCLLVARSSFVTSIPKLRCRIWNEHFTNNNNKRLFDCWSDEWQKGSVKSVFILGEWHEPFIKSGKGRLLKLLLLMRRRNRWWKFINVGSDDRNNNHKATQQKCDEKICHF